MSMLRTDLSTVSTPYMSRAGASPTKSPASIPPSLFGVSQLFCRADLCPARKSVSIKGDASHLKEIEIKGTDDNELYTKFRERVAKASPPEAKHAAEDFIGDHPESVVGLWLIRKYFISDALPDYQTALRLAQKMQSKQTDQADLSRMIRLLDSMAHVGIGSALPDFQLTIPKDASSLRQISLPALPSSARGHHGVMTAWTCCAH